MSRVRTLFTSVRYTRPGQLAHRLRLTAKRRAAETSARFLALGARLENEPAPKLRAALPQPVFPPRSETVVQEAGLPFARILQHRLRLVPPIDWRWPRDRPGSRLDRLTLHYHEWAEGLDDAAFEGAIRDWIDANPPYGPRYWCDAWNSYAVSIRCVVWLQQLAIRRPRLTPEVVARVTVSLVAQLRFLRSNLELDIGGNHLIRDIKALLWAARAFEGEEAVAWGERGAMLLDRELATQVLPDGVHFERSPAYHAQVFADLLECAHVLPDGALRARVGVVLDAMAQVLADLTHPDACVSQFNDGGLHMAYPPAVCLDVHRRHGGAAVAPRAVAAFRDAGYFTARHGGDLVVVDCGRLGPDELPAHAHGDALAFEWSLAGRRWIVDAGVFEYQGALRPWSRATRNHNTVTLDDADQAEFWSAFRMARRPNVAVNRYEATGSGFRLEGSHDGYAYLPGSPIHERQFEVRPDRIAVRDTIRGGAGQAMRARLLLSPEITVGRDGADWILAAGSARARFVTSSPVTMASALYAPDFGERHDTTQLVLDYGRAPGGGAFILERLP